MQNNAEFGVTKEGCETMNLSENEKQALRKLREELFARYPIIDIRLFGSKARGQGDQDSDLDVMIEIPDYDRAVVAEIDDIIYRINLEHDVFISALVFGKNEVDDGPMSEAPVYKAIQREGVPL
ncbi:MAG: nucleotidyltransferase domain-containing protein [Thermodesulfobacteriota bacterium]